MKKGIYRGFAAVVLCAIASAANALTVNLWVTTPPAQQNNTSKWTARMSATATTTLYNLSLAVGYTVQCEKSSLTLDEQDGAKISDYLPRTDPLTLTVYLPGSGNPGPFDAPGYSSLSNGTCELCTFKAKASATEAYVTFTGAGFSVTVGGANPLEKVTTPTFQMCKPGGGASC